MLYSGGRLTIANCAVRNFIYGAISIQPTSGTVTVSIVNSIASENTKTSSGATGIGFYAGGSSTINGVISKTVVDDNDFGIAVFANTKALIEDSLVSGNTNSGVATFGGATRLSRSAVTGNGYGVYINGGSVASYGDNRINGNTTDITGGSLTYVATR